MFMLLYRVETCLLLINKYINIIIAKSNLALQCLNFFLYAIKVAKIIAKI